MIRNLVSLLVLMLVIAPCDGFAQDIFWKVDFGTGFTVDGQIYAVEVTPQVIYIGGSFTHVAGIAANHIAKFENGVWDSLGGGVDGDVHALKSFSVANQTLLYVGGNFHHADTVVSPGFALWNSNKWYALGEGLEPFGFGVYSIVVDASGNPYAAGGFTIVRANHDTLNNIAHWDGGAWKPLAGGVANSRGALPVFSILLSKDTLYVGGFFDFVDHHMPAKGVARWFNGAWSPVGNIDSGDVHVTSLALHRGELYAAGEFTSIGKDTARGIARWDGTRWHSLGDDPGYWIGSLASSGNLLYASRFDVGSTGTRFNNIAFFTGGIWRGLESGIHGGIMSIAPYGFNGVIAAGYFDSAGRKPAHGLATWESPEAVKSYPSLVTSSITIYPSPFQEQGFVECMIDQPGELALTISDLLGRTVSITNFSHLASGTQKLPLHLASGIKTGTYFLRLSGPKQNGMMKPFIVVK